MTKELQSTNDQKDERDAELFVIRTSSFFRHSCFVIRHFRVGQTFLSACSIDKQQRLSSESARPLDQLVSVYAGIAVVVAIPVYSGYRGHKVTLKGSESRSGSPPPTEACSV